MSDFRARSSSEILDAAFELYRSAFPVFFAINLVAGLAPAANIYLRALNGPVSNLYVAFPLLTALVSILLYPFTSAVTIAAASSMYLNGSTDVASAVKDGLRHPVRVFFAVLLKGLIMAIGFVLLIIPGVMAYQGYFAVPATTVLENTSITRSLTRSTELASDNGWRILGLIGLTALFVAIVSLVFDGLAAATRIGIVAAVLDLIVFAAIGPFVNILTVVLYYDIRIRKEALDIELMSNAIDSVPGNISTPSPAV